MTWGLLIPIGIQLAVVALVARAKGVLGGAAARQREAARFARRSGLPAEPPHPALVARLSRRNRFVLIGVAAGVVLSFTGADDGVLWPTLLYVGLGAGAVLARFTERPPAPDSPRVAHAMETSVSDYLPTWLLVVVPLVAAAAVGYAVLALVAPRRADPAPPLVSDVRIVLLAAVAVAGLGLAGLLARLVVQRRRTVVTVEELEVDDALRASAVRDCLQLSAALSVFALWAISWAMTDQPVQGFARRVGGWTPVGTLVAIAVVGTVFELTGGPRWWRSRLRRGLPA